MRIHAPELEDEPWCPAFLRDGLTTFLRLAAEVFPVHDSGAQVFADVVRRHGSTRFIDLCSGSGGPLLRLLEVLREEHDIDIEAVLTDLYPNHEAFAKAEQRGAGKVRGVRDAIDATNVPDELAGVRTMFNAFHHFRPELAKKIIADAAQKKQPFVSLEIVERRLGTVLFLMGTPIAALFLTPLGRPVPWSRLFFTYVVPVIPLGIWWDGMMSCLRSYSVDELRELAAQVDVEGYAFRVEQIPVPWLPVRVTIFIGEPLA